MKKLIVFAFALGISGLAMGQETPAACPAGGAACSVAGEAKACCAEGEGACCADAAKTQLTKLTKVSYKVNDLACGACETKVTAALAKIDGVKVSKACSTSKQVALTYDPKKAKDAQLVAAIQMVGFKVNAEVVELKVDGMTCEGCSGKVTKAIASLKGVQEQNVCHVNKHALVTFDPNTLTRDQLVAAINKTGFEVVQ